uniref:Protein-glutamine gamma-glutamyltransferase TgpA N-terminal domain-containing protein n=1 Tax=Anopheles darlingi TaxID=43151 RepID=A0A2M4CR15_ANODA
MVLMSCCSFASSSTHGTDGTVTAGHRYPYGSDASNVTEKHYGCYKAGIFFALAIILLLLVGCVPVFLLTANSNLILLILLVTLLLIGLATFIYFRWQRNRALAMRRTYEQQKFALTRLPAASTAAASALSATVPGSKDETANGKAGQVNGNMYGHQNMSGVKGEVTTGGGGSEQSSQRTTTTITANQQPRYSFI